MCYTGGDSSGGRQTRNGVAVCSQKRALCVTAIVLAALLGTALVIAYAGPQNGKYCLDATVNIFINHSANIFLQKFSFIYFLTSNFYISLADIFIIKNVEMK